MSDILFYIKYSFVMLYIIAMYPKNVLHIRNVLTKTPPNIFFVKLGAPSSILFRCGVR